MTVSMGFPDLSFCLCEYEDYKGAYVSVQGNSIGVFLPTMPTIQVHVEKDV